MAKKNVKRKVSSGVRTTSSVDAAPVIVEAPAAAAVSSAPRGYGRRGTSVTEEFHPDYSYIIGDLKRIGMIAGGFFAILIVLSFIIK
ncbi:MAG TPA: hypothetical protein VFM46_18505 [Pseudomonadales bacterium]|nr:hypothetical protein [Pseudomonadales bacterium]